MIGVFDSGIGGLGVLGAMLPLFGGAEITFVADRANAPYGVRSLTQVRDLTHRHAASLIDAGAGTVVIACNTASAAALNTLRDTFPNTRFVGMEPAIKPATAATETGVIGVLATQATFQGELFASLVDEYATNLTVIPRAAPEWVQLVEQGNVGGPEVEKAIQRHTDPIMEQGADTLVLGCTHFPFLTDSIREVVGHSTTIIDPAAAVARQARQVHEIELEEPMVTAWVSGDRDNFETLSRRLAGISFPGGVLPLYR